ncbi:MAG TPA: SprB repeat-containing protein, partial [Chitinophagales bacterium]|nr:SprB repeat-containing protein [Chitinophagales bacterium]
MQNYNQCLSNWFHTVDFNFGPGWDLSTFTPISIPMSCDGMGNWGYYTNVTSVVTGQSYGPCFSYDSPLGFLGNVLDGNPGNNYGDNCTVYTWTFCFSIMVGATSYGQSLFVEATAVGDGSAGAWSQNTCPGTTFYIDSTTYSMACFLSATSVVVEPSCLNNDGSIAVNVTGNIGPASYNWSPGGQTTSSISGLSAGSYEVTVSDSVNCEAVYTFEIDFNNPVTVSDSVSDAVCYGYCDGIAEVFPANGTAPYTYNWLPGGNTASYDSALCAGTYYVTVTDSNYCSRIDTFTVGAPEEIVLTPSTHDVSCYGAYDGWPTADATHGSGVYFTYWHPTGQNSQTAKYLIARTYTVTATDIKGCFTNLP